MQGEYRFFPLRKGGAVIQWMLWTSLVEGKVCRGHDVHVPQAHRSDSVRYREMAGTHEGTPYFGHWPIYRSRCGNNFHSRFLRILSYSVRNAKSYVVGIISSTYVSRWTRAFDSAHSWFLEIIDFKKWKAAISPVGVTYQNGKEALAEFLRSSQLSIR